MSYTLRTDKSWAETELAIRETMRKWGVVRYEVLSSRRGVQAQSWNQRKDEAEVVVNFVHPVSGTMVPVTSKDQDRAVDNLRVCWLALEAIRLNELRGIADVVREAYLQLPAPAKVRDPWEVLGLRPEAPDELIEPTYRALAQSRHPDKGGSAEAFTELQAAYEAVKQQRGLAR